MKCKRQIITTLSHPRFERYLQACGADVDNALKLYRKNQVIAERMFVPIQNLEVGLRNALNQVLATQWGECWYEGGVQPLSCMHQKKVEEAKDNLLKMGKPVEPGRVVAELTFSFWAGMFSGYYEHLLWNKGLLIYVFPFAPLSIVTKDVKSDLDGIRLFRNRIYHHEPVFRKAHLISVHDGILKILAWINPEYRAWNDKNDGFLGIKYKL